MTESTEATENQVASVIAEYEQPWREVAEKSGDCRLVWVLDSQDDPVSKLNGSTCYLRERTASTTAQLALSDLEALNVPASMEALVSKTRSALEPIANAELEEACGSEEWPIETEECSNALGANFSSFNALTKTLDAWKPYL